MIHYLSERYISYDKESKKTSSGKIQIQKNIINEYVILHSSPQKSLQKVLISFKILDIYLDFMYWHQHKIACSVEF